MQEGRKLRIEEMTTFLNGMSQELTEYDEQMVRKYIEKITVLTTTSKSNLRWDSRLR